MPIHDTIEPGDLVIPDEVPVMFLHETVLMPHTHLPLFIFEPRYRAMLAYALERERMFCVAMMKSDVDDVRSSDDYHRVCGIGLVRACVARPDGTSHLVLQGMARVELGDLLQQKPFFLAPARVVPESIRRGEWIETMMAEILDLCSSLPAVGEGLHEEIASIRVPGPFADAVANVFLSNATRRQQILEEPEVAARLDSLRQFLKEQTPG